MKIIEGNKSEGRFRLEVYNPDGSYQDTGWLHNLGMNGRLAVISGLYGGTGAQTAFTYLAVGTGSSNFSDPTQTTLGAEIVDSGLARAAATVSRITTTVTNDTTQFTKTWTASGTKTVHEIGYFNDPTAGVMGGRADTGALAVVSGSQIVATYRVQHS